MQQLRNQDPRPVIGKLWAYYDDTHVRLRSMPAGKETARYAWRNLQVMFAQREVFDLNQQSVDSYLEFREAGLIGRPSVPTTVRRELATMLAALRYCAEQQLIRLDEIRSLRLPAASIKRKRVLTVAETVKLFDVAESGRLSDNRLTKLERFLWIGLQTAARKTSILNLDWGRVDFRLGLIDFNEPGRKETKKRRVAVAMSDALRPVLERAYRERISDFVLDNSYDGIWAQMQILAAKAFGGPPTPKGKCPKGMGIGPHTLRHTAATMMARAGVPLFHVAGVLGNTLQMTEAVYAHQAPADPNVAVNFITGRWLRPPR